MQPQLRAPFVGTSGRELVGGGPRLLRAFPGARAIATKGTWAEARLQAQDEYRNGFWGRLFPGQIPDPVLPELLDSKHFDLEGHELQIVDTGHTTSTSRSSTSATSTKQRSAL